MNLEEVLNCENKILRIATHTYCGGKVYLACITPDKDCYACKDYREYTGQYEVCQNQKLLRTIKEE